MAMPTRTPDPAGDKRRTIKLAEHAAKRANEAQSALSAALRFAHDHGASLRELEAATGIPFRTVGRIIDRLPIDPIEMAPTCPRCHSQGVWRPRTVLRTDPIMKTSTTVWIWTAVCSKDDEHWFMPGRDLTPAEAAEQ